MGFLFSQQDVSIGNISIVGGEPLCPTNSVKFQVEISVSGAPENDVDGDTFYFQVNGPIPRAAANYTIDGSAHPSGNGRIANGTTKTFIFPDHFDSVGGSSMAPLDLSNFSGPYTITASITYPLILIYLIMLVHPLILILIHQQIQLFLVAREILLVYVQGKILYLQ